MRCEISPVFQQGRLDASLNRRFHRGFLRPAFRFHGLRSQHTTGLEKSVPSLTVSGAPPQIGLWLCPTGPAAYHLWNFGVDAGAGDCDSIEPVGQSHWPIIQKAM